MPLWYVVRDGDALWAWTYAKSQKVRNLERDPRATLQVEAGEQYHQLRGVMLECEARVHRDTDCRAGARRWSSSPATRRRRRRPTDDRAMVARRRPSASALEFVERRRATWDHRKLGGVY